MTYQFDHAAKLAFVEAANPHQWLLTAINLHEQAMTLWLNRGKSLLTYIDRDGNRTTWDATNRSTFLLAGLAMENMLKAFLVYEEPDLVANGRLGCKIQSHDLSKLSRHSSKLPYKDRDQWVFVSLGEGITSWARYPCGLNANDVEPEGHFGAKLWIKYCAVMDAYAAKLRRLLMRGWTGPHGYYGRWTFS